MQPHHLSPGWGAGSPSLENVMILLFVAVLFYSSVGRPPYVAAIVAPSLAACEAKAAEQSAKANADPEVRGFTFKCVVVPDKT